MTLLELVKYLRLSILDDRAGQGIDWTTIYEDDPESVLIRWQNEELVGFINEAITQVYRRILPVQKYDDCFNIDIEDGVAEYDIDPRILRILSIRLETLNLYLEELDHQDLIDNTHVFNRERDVYGNEFTFKSRWEDETGNPTGYLPDYGSGTIRVYPIPTADDVALLLTNRLPLKQLDWQNHGETPELRNEFQIPMLNYAAHLAYLKEDANTLDPNKSATHFALFNSEFPATSAYSDTRKRRTTNRTIRYGGI